MSLPFNLQHQVSTMIATKRLTVRSPRAKKESARNHEMKNQKFVKTAARRNCRVWELVITKLVWPRVPVASKLHRLPDDNAGA